MGKEFPLEQRSANIFCKEQNGKYFWLFKPDGPCHSYSIRVQKQPETTARMGVAGFQ